MIDFGKIISYTAEGNRVSVAFEHETGIVDVITDSIVRFYCPLSGEETYSKAIEGDKHKAVNLRAEKLEEELVIRTEKLEIRIFEGFKADIYDENGKVLCRDYRGNRKALKHFTKEMQELMEQEGHQVQKNSIDHKIQVVKEMNGEECFYGLGDKTGFLNKRNYDYVMWNTDNPAPQVDCFQSLYKSIPFFITLTEDTVYGLFFDNTFRSYFDMGKESEDYFWFGADEGNLDYYFIGGESFKEVVSNYTYLTGTAPLPQLWTLGYQQSRWGYKTEKEFRELVDNMRKYELPCDAFCMDIDYMDAFKVFTVNEKRFPDMKKYVQDLKEQGIKLVTIIDPGVKKEEGYEVYDEGVKKGYFAKDKDGEIYENVVWPGESVYPDFGRKEVRDWWGENHKILLDAGIRGIWNDMNEPASFRGELPQDVVFYDEDKKSDHAEMHNVYGHYMGKATYEGLKKMDGRRPFVLTRACYSGSQKYAAGWTGDNHSIWAHLQMAIPQLCNLGLSGMPIVGTDIGGFGSDTTEELMIRWVQVGCFSVFCRNHAAMGTRNQEPWEFSEKALNIYRKYLELRYSLLPYYYDLLVEEEKTGLPVMRPLVLNYEHDRMARNCNDEFMIGDSILVAPVVEQGAVYKMVYLPEGDWYDFWTGEKIAGGQTFVREAGIDVCPVYVKAGSIIPRFQKCLSTDFRNKEELILDVYPGDGEYIHYQDDGETFDYREGVYNKYRFVLKDGNITTEVLHQGYKKPYEKISINFAAK